MTVFVLDNSVTMRWFFDSGTHPYADAILQNLKSPGSAAVVPVIWRYEVSAVLARAQQQGAIPAKEFADFITDLGALSIHVDAQSSLRILSDVHQIALTYGLTSYDAAYLELALRRGLPLATLDADLVRAAKVAGASIVRAAHGAACRVSALSGFHPYARSTAGCRHAACCRWQHSIPVASPYPV